MPNPHPLKFIAGILLGCLLVATTAHAASNQALLDVLLKRGVLTQQEYNRLSASNGEKAAKQSKAPAAKKTKNPSGSSNLVLGHGGGLKYHTSDGQFAFQLGGRMQADGAIYDDDKEKLGSGAEIRSARLYIKGVVYKDWGFDAQFEFTDGDNPIRNAYLSYLGFDNSTIKAGSFKEPFSLEAVASPNNTTFTELALPVSVFKPGRRIGASLDTHGERWHAAIGGFGNGVSGGPQVDAKGNEQNSGWSVAGRATYDPVYGKRQLFHVGGSVEYREPAGAETLRFRTRPETHVTNVNLVSTGKIKNVNDYQTYGLESAAAAGPFSLQGEYLLNHVNRDGENVDFHGWYIYGSWFITGQSRAAQYDPSAGKFGRPDPHDPLGAWELALRYSSVNLSDGPIKGGKEDDVTVGVNWYVNSYVRLSANYVNVVNQHKKDVSDEPQMVQFRAQVAF